MSLRYNLDSPLRTVVPTYAACRPIMVRDTCPHDVCWQWSNGPCTVNLAFLAPPSEAGDDQ